MSTVNLACRVRKARAGFLQAVCNCSWVFEGGQTILVLFWGLLDILKMPLWTHEVAQSKWRRSRNPQKLRAVDFRMVESRGWGPAGNRVRDLELVTCLRIVSEAKNMGGDQMVGFPWFFLDFSSFSALFTLTIFFFQALKLQASRCQFANFFLVLW